jgi:sugar phosphate isomerase/epimerase
MTIDLGFSFHPKWVGRGSIKDFLAPLQEAGLTVLEFTLHSEGDEWPSMQALAEECVAAGYRCHFHAPYQGQFNPYRFAGEQREALMALYAPALDLAERLAHEGGFAPALVIHGAHGVAPLDELAEDTREFLAWILERTQHARPMLELLPPKPGFVRLGETHEQVLEMVRRLDDARLGICWDLGHDVLQGYKALPPDDFLAGVRHVHIHDINDAQEDHFPLIYGNVPWEADLRALLAAGFAGAVVMEINGYRASRVPRLYDRLVESFAAMRAVISSGR